jgi:hypothetical protein
VTSGISWFQIAAEESELVVYLAKSNLWAFAWNVDPTRPEYPPGPISEFVRDHGEPLTRGYQATSARWAERNAAYWKDPSAARPNDNDWGEPRNIVYIGTREAVCAPRVHEFERLEGGIVEPTGQPGVGTIVGGANVLRRTLADDNELMRYERGGWLPHLDAYAGATLSCPTSVGKRVLAWVRRWTPHEVPVTNARYTRRATKGAASAAERGTRFI